MRRHLPDRADRPSLRASDRVALSARLDPAEWFPAGVAGITVRRVQLASGVTLRVLEAGPETGPPLLLLHGFALSAYLWRANILPLAAAGFRVYAPDLPGHGLSDVPTGAGAFTLARFAALVGELMDALQVPRAVIFAQSMAGKIAVQFALDAPQRVSRLVLFGPVGFGFVPPVQALVPFLPAVPGRVITWFVPRRLAALVQRRVYGKLGYFTERDIDEYWAPSQFPALVRAQIEMVKKFSWEPWDAATLKRLTTPTHVVFGTRDRTVRPLPTEHLAAQLPNGRLTLILDGGHVVMEEVPDRINALLLAEARGLGFVG